MTSARCTLAHVGRARQNHLLAGVFAVAAAVVVAGCGGSDSETSSIDTVSTGSSTSNAISQDAFIKQADAICAEANSAVRALPVASVGAAGNVTVTQEQQIVKGQLQSLKSLGTPDSGGPQLDRYLTALQDQVTALQQESQALQSGGDSATASAAVDTATSNAQAAARAFGMQACAGSATPVGTSTTTGGNGGTGGTAGSTTPVTPVTPVTPATPAAPAPAPTPAPVPPPAAGGGTGTPPAGGTGGGSGGTGGSGGVGAG
jgi:hypothetical protein